MPSSTHLQVPWQSSSPVVVPNTVRDAELLVRQYAITLREADKKAVVNAFANADYAMGASHLWRRSVSRLRARLAKLGMQFLGEMLNRVDISDQSNPDAVLTEADTIYLAEALGFVDATGARRLRTSLELVSHFDSDNATEEMSVSEAETVARASIQYVLGSEETGASLDFSKFRERLLTTDLGRSDTAVEGLLASPLFFIRTALRTLIAAIKTEQGAKLEHTLANLNMLLPNMWAALTDEDRSSVGTAFAEISNEGDRPSAIAGLRKALMRVQGFDYVPESLRSNSFKRAAQAVLTAHHNLNNFYNEPEPTRQLASMGTSIPRPAVAECLRAYLSVYLGNPYGQCWEAANIAHKELKKLPATLWEGYFTRIFAGQDDILRKLESSRSRARWVGLARELNFGDLTVPSGTVRKLLEASCAGNELQVTRFATSLLADFRGENILAA